MKIHCDSLQESIDELEKSKIAYKEKIKNLSEVSNNNININYIQLHITYNKLTLTCINLY